MKNSDLFYDLLRFGVIDIDEKYFTDNFKKYLSNKIDLQHLKVSNHTSTTYNGLLTKIELI